MGLGLVLGTLPVAGATAPYDPTPVVPKDTIVLFDGAKVTDLTRFYTWLPAHGYTDPNRVFTVVDYLDGGPAIRISGQDFGGLVTKQSYANYHLVVEYRWGAVTWKPRADKVRNSGILLHCQGEDGNLAKNFRSPWISSVEYEIAEGITGDLLLLSGYVRGSDRRLRPRLRAPARWGAYPDSPDGKPPSTASQPTGPGRVGYRVWHPQGVPMEFAAGEVGRVEWLEKDPAWTNELGFRGRREVERPVGEWNRVEAIADGGRLTFWLNGVKINEATDCTPSDGRLLFQSEGSEVFYRRIEVHPVGKIEVAKARR